MRRSRHSDHSLESHVVVPVDEVCTRVESVAEVAAKAMVAERQRQRSRSRMKSRTQATRVRTCWCDWVYIPQSLDVEHIRLLLRQHSCQHIGRRLLLRLRLLFISTGRAISLDTLLRGPRVRRGAEVERALDLVDLLVLEVREVDEAAEERLAQRRRRARRREAGQGRQVTSKAEGKRIWSACVQRGEFVLYEFGGPIVPANFLHLSVDVQLRLLLDQCIAIHLEEQLRAASQTEAGVESDGE